MSYILRRFVPRFDPRWLIPVAVVGVVLAATTFLRVTSPAAELELLAVGPDGQFHHILDVPPDWSDTETVTPDAVARFPLILGVRNVGYANARPGRLILSVPARYRITDAWGEQLPTAYDPASPLVSYLIYPRLETVEPGRLPTLLPAHETLWVEAVVPRYYCVELAQAIPEFVAAPPPPLQAMSEIVLFYAFQDGDLDRRQTGTLTLRVDTTLLAVTMPEQPPTFPMHTDPQQAWPDLGPLQYVGTTDIRCGEPEAPMEMVSTVWETDGGARVITLSYDGAVRKYLFDANGDGIIDRESWDPEGYGRFTATRRAHFPIPSFLLPETPSIRYDMSRFAELPADSLARLDPLRGAMAGPGPMPRLGEAVVEREPPPPPPRPTGPTPLGRPAPAEAAAPAARPAPATPPAPAAEPEAAPPPPPVRRPQQPLGRPVDRI
jgi:hypothetical protein